MTQLYKNYLTEQGLTYPQFLTLFTLWKKDGRSVREINEALLLDGATVTPLLKRMEAKGLIRRQRSAEDERVVQVLLTERGAQLESMLEKVAGGLLCDIGLTPLEVKEMAGTLNELRTTIESSSARHRKEAKSGAE